MCHNCHFMRQHFNRHPKKQQQHDTTIKKKYNCMKKTWLPWLKPGTQAAHVTKLQFYIHTQKNRSKLVMLIGNNEFADGHQWSRK